MLKSVIIFEADGEEAKIDSVDKNVYEISADLLPHLQKEIDKLNKKAAKTGSPEIKVNVLNTYYNELAKYGEADQVRIRMGQKPFYEPRIIKQKMVKVSIEGDRPQVAGWDFLAVVEGKKEGNVLRLAPGAEGKLAELKKYYNSDAGVCDWCKKRRMRTNTYLVQSVDTGEMKQVGSNCLKDFLGGKSPQSIAKFFEWFDNLDEYIKRLDDHTFNSGRYGRVEDYHTVQDILTWGVVAARLFGYKPSSFDRSTASVVRMMTFWPPDSTLEGGQANPSYDEYKQVLKAKTPADEEKAKDILKWFTEQIPQQQKDNEPYFHNLDILIKEGHVKSKEVGYIVGLIPTYSKATNQDYYQKQAPRANQHVGQVGSKIPPTKVKVMRVHMITGQFGNTQIVNMEDESGNIYVWFNNGSQRLAQGDEGTIIGTVKKHDEYQGRKQTNLTRCKFLD